MIVDDGDNNRKSGSMIVDGGDKFMQSGSMIVGGRIIIGSLVA
jgi:hypothetical protein